MKLIIYNSIIIIMGTSLSTGGTNFIGVQQLELSDAITIALANNPSIEIARARVKNAMGNLQQVRALYWPSIFFDTSLFPKDINKDMEKVTSYPLDVYSTGLQTKWLVFDGFTRRFKNIAARHALLRSKDTMQDVQRKLVGAVANAFFAAQLARENIAIAQADKTFNLRQLKESQDRHNAGSGSLSDTLNFKVRTNAARSSLIHSERLYKSTLEELTALLGEAESQFRLEIVIAPLKFEEKPEILALDEDSLVKLALANRPDVQSLINEQQRAVAQEKATRGNFFPVITLSGTVNGSWQEINNFNSDDFSTSIGAILTYPFSDGGASRGRLQKAKAIVLEAKSKVEARAIDVATEIKKLIHDLHAFQEDLKLQRENADLVELNRDIVEKEYNAGHGSLVRLNEAQRELVASRSKLVLGLVVLRRAHVNLRVATGQIYSILEPSENTK